MARLSVILREKKRRLTVMKYADKRKRLKLIQKSTKSSLEEIEAARQEMHKMPRNSSSVRLRNRCRLTGRPHGYYRKFGICRNMLRQAAMRGDVPGLILASW